MSKLTEKRCVPCEGGTPALTAEQAKALARELAPRWKLADDAKKIQARLEFKNYFRTIAFVNAVAYIAIDEDHHPDISFGYNTCTVEYSTHAVGGLSENDFICAAKIDRLLAS